jgi:hypothetical protein
MGRQSASSLSTPLRAGPATWPTTSRLRSRKHAPIAARSWVEIGLMLRWWKKQHRPSAASVGLSVQIPTPRGKGVAVSFVEQTSRTAFGHLLTFYRDWTNTCDLPGEPLRPPGFFVSPETIGLQQRCPDRSAAHRACAIFGQTRRLISLLALIGTRSRPTGDTDMPSLG